MERAMGLEFNLNFPFFKDPAELSKQEAGRSYFGVPPINASMILFVTFLHYFSEFILC